MTEWWHYAVGVGLLVLILAVCLIPEAFDMYQLRKERGLQDYDTKQFANKTSDEREDDSGA